MPEILLTYAGYLLFFLSLGGNLVQYKLSRRDKRRDVQEERRYEVYSAYLEKLDRTNERLYLAQQVSVQDGELGGFFSSLLEASKDGGSILDNESLQAEHQRLVEKQMQLLVTWRDEVAKLSDQANRVRLIAGDATISALSELESALANIGDKQIQNALDSLSGGMRLLDLGEIETAARDQERMKDALHFLRAAMRREIGVAN